MKIHVDVSGLNLNSEYFNQGVEKGLDYSSEYIKEVLIKNTPTDKGRGRQNYVINRREKIREITNSTFYLPFVNDGTGIYGSRGRPITPVHARVLAFKWKGRMWFLKSVKGQKPQKFVEKSIDETKDKIQGLIIKGIKEVGI